jgi:hypothetical protein
VAWPHGCASECNLLKHIWVLEPQQFLANRAESAYREASLLKMQLLESTKEYFAVCGVYSAVTVMKLYECAVGPQHYMRHSSLELNKYFVAFVTLLIGAYLIRLLWRTTVPIEIATICLTLSLGVIELVAMGPQFGILRITIPHKQDISGTICFVATVLAIVRAVDVWSGSRFHRNRAES